MKNEAIEVAANTMPQPQWKGYTIDELRRRRAKALIKRELARVKFTHEVGTMRERASQQGMRGLLFKNNVVAGLNKTDYLFLSYKAIRALLKWWARRRK